MARNAIDEASPLPSPGGSSSLLDKPLKALRRYFGPTALAALSLAGGCKNTTLDPAGNKPGVCESGRWEPPAGCYVEMCYSPKPNDPTAFPCEVRVPSECEPYSKMEGTLTSTLVKGVLHKVFEDPTGCGKVEAAVQQQNGTNSGCITVHPQDVKIQPACVQ